MKSDAGKVDLVMTLMDSSRPNFCKGTIGSFGSLLWPRNFYLNWTAGSTINVYLEPAERVDIHRSSLNETDEVQSGIETAHKLCFLKARDDNGKHFLGIRLKAGEEQVREICAKKRPSDQTCFMPLTESEKVRLGFDCVDSQWELTDKGRQLDARAKTNATQDAIVRRLMRVLDHAAAHETATQKVQRFFIRVQEDIDNLENSLGLSSTGTPTRTGDGQQPREAGSGRDTEDGEEADEMKNHGVPVFRARKRSRIE